MTILTRPGIIACIAPLVRFSTLGYLRQGTTDLTCKHYYIPLSSLLQFCVLISSLPRRLDILPVLDGRGVQSRTGGRVSLLTASAAPYLPMDIESKLPVQGADERGTTGVAQHEWYM